MSIVPRIVFTVTRAEKNWYEELFRAAGDESRIAFFFRLLDEEAERIGFPLRPER